METNQNLELFGGKNNEIKSHAELVSASSTQAVLSLKQQRQALKILNQVQDDNTYFNNNGFTRPSSFPSPRRTGGVGNRHPSNLSFPKAVIGNLYLGKMRKTDPRQKHSGMTKGVRHSGMTNAASGFTPIELLVVVLIVGILAGVAVPQYNKAVKKSRATEAILNLHKIQQAREVYFIENGVKTTDLTQLDITIQEGFYRYKCRESGSCYATPVDGTAPFFEKESSGTLYCRGTAEECRPFSTEPGWSGYWIMRL